MKLQNQDQLTKTEKYYVVQPSKGLDSLHLRDMYIYRNLIGALVARDLKTRYRQTALGPLWVLLSPFISMVVISMIFGGLAKLPSEGFPYPIFLYSATIPWSFFTTIINKTMTSQGQFISWMSKVYIPRLVPPVVLIISGLVDWCVSFFILIGLMWFYHIPAKIALLTLPFFLLVAFIVGFPIGLIGSVVSIKYRDFTTMISYGLTVWYYLTPVLYSANLLPPQLEWLYQLNPMYWVIQGFRWAILGVGSAPQPFMLIPTGFFLLLFIGALYFFQYASRNIVDIQ